MKQILCATVMLLAFASAKGTAAAPDADEIAVYRSAFNGHEAIAVLKPGQDDRLHPVPANMQSRAFLKENLPGVEDATITDFIQKIRTTPALTPQTNIGIKLIFVDRKDVDEIFAHTKNPKEDWHIAEMRAEQTFQKHFSVDGVTTMSHVAFNPGGTQALVYVEKNGEATTYLVEKTGGKWAIKDRVTVGSE